MFSFPQGSNVRKIERSFFFVLYTVSDSPSPTTAPLAAASGEAAGTECSQPRPRAALKGQQTKATIIEAALNMAMHIGLEGLSIGGLAQTLGMSKSGVFAHFGSREELQISVVREYHQRFEREVFYTALQQPRGLPRLRALFDHWMQRTTIELDSGCIYISGAIEFDERTGPVRDALVESVSAWHAALQRSIEQCKECGHLRADTDAAQVLFEVHGLILVLHYEARFMRKPDALPRALRGFDNVLQRYAAPSPLPASEAAQS